MATSQQVRDALEKHQAEIRPVLPAAILQQNPFIFDFTAENDELAQVDMNDTAAFSRYISAQMHKHNTLLGIGRYNEHRTIYARSPLFAGEQQPRTVHLAIDLWAEQGTPVFSPLPGKVHSFQNNAAFGDYGPTIILEHTLDGVTFYTLYGHLSLDSIEHLHPGQHIAAGQRIASIGNYPVNGSWPPHLHFQLIADMQGKKGDFAGVASLAQREHFVELCPDPNMILGIKGL